MKMSEIRAARIARKEQAINLKSQGYSVKQIAKIISISIFTVYKYLQEDYDENHYDRIMNALFEGIESLDSLKYSEISCLCRKTNNWGVNKEMKLRHLKESFKNYLDLHLDPRKAYTKNQIKIAFKSRAKQTHPDLNKNESKEGALFQQVYKSYNNLMAKAVI